MTTTKQSTAKQSTPTPYAHITWDILYTPHIDGLVQDCNNSIANALELLQSCTKPSICPIEVHFIEVHIHPIQVHLTSPCILSIHPLLQSRLVPSSTNSTNRHPTCSHQSLQPADLPTGPHHCCLYLKARRVLSRGKLVPDWGVLCWPMQAAHQDQSLADDPPKDAYISRGKSTRQSNTDNIFITFLHRTNSARMTSTPECLSMKKIYTVIHYKGSNKLPTKC